MAKTDLLTFLESNIDSLDFDGKIELFGINVPRHLRWN